MFSFQQITVNIRPKDSVDLLEIELGKVNNATQFTTYIFRNFLFQMKWNNIVPCN